MEILILIGISNGQVAVRAGGFSAMVVVGMAVLGVAVLYAVFYVWLGVDSPGAMKVTECKFLPASLTNCIWTILLLSISLDLKPIIVLSHDHELSQYLFFLLDMVLELHLLLSLLNWVVEYIRRQLMLVLTLSEKWSKEFLKMILVIRQLLLIWYYFC